MSPPQANSTNDIEAISNVFALGFQHVAFTAYILRTPDSTWPATSIPLDILGPKMIELTKYKHELGAEMVEAGNFAAAAIWYVLYIKRHLKSLEIYSRWRRNWRDLRTKADYREPRFPPGLELAASPNDDPRIVEYREIAKKVKKEHLNGRKYWYLNIIARHPERNDPGKEFSVLLLLYFTRN